MPPSAAAHGNQAPTVEGRVAGDRGGLVAQRGLFTGPSPVCPDDLYAEVVRGAATRARTRLAVHPHSRVSTGGYFGRFPASYWQRWTVVDRVDVELVAYGSGKVSLIASDVDGETRVVAAQLVTDAKGDTVRFSTALDKFLDGGALWLDFTTDDADLAVEALRWTVEPPAELRPTSVVICTFNRPADCVGTLAALAADQQVLDVLDAVYVVDQGSDTAEAHPEFADAEKALDGRLRYLRQLNLGGAGGFGRGMYEVTEVSHADHANVLLMDDDVLCEPEIAIRLTAFANRTAEPTIVGGQMLRLLHPTRLVAGAEYADFDNLVPGKVVDGALDDADLLGVDEETGEPNRGDLRVDADYNAWWACLIPSEVVAKVGYPLPLFFQWDDVEYGYRARAAGFPTVTLPGAGLWHADFDWKDHDKWNEYFAVRNAMIVSAMYGRFEPVQIARVVLSRIMRNLLSMQYGLTASIIKAVEDFLRGPSVLADGGTAAAAEVRELRAAYPETVLRRASDVPGLQSGRIPTVRAADTPLLKRPMLAKRLTQLAVGRSAHEIGAVPHEDAVWWHLAQFDTVVVTDASQEGVRIRTKDRAMTVALLRRTARAIRRLLSDGRRLRAEYRAAAPRLASRENWKRLWSVTGSVTEERA